MDRTLSPRELGAALLLLARTRGELVARFRGSSVEPTVPGGAELLLRHREQPSPARSRPSCPLAASSFSKNEA